MYEDEFISEGMGRLKQFFGDFVDIVSALSDFHLLLTEDPLLFT